MQFKKPNEVVGNHIAKYQAMKLAKMIMAYDFERRLNPFVETGGFIFTFMGDGTPGTGKTTLIQMMAGLISGYCEVAGYPFRYQNFSIDQIDSYQGKSGQNAKAFITNVLDPTVIGFGTIDDIDQIAGKRGDRQSSAGQQEVTAVFMEAFSGANTVVRGNCTFGMFSNYPENVDDALRQRAGARFLVDGPQSREDYIDILALLLGKNHAIPLGEHELFAAQEIKRAVAASLRKPRPAARGRAGARSGKDREARSAGSTRWPSWAPTSSASRRPTPALPAARSRTSPMRSRSGRWISNCPTNGWRSPTCSCSNPMTTSWRCCGMAQPITVEMVIQEINRYADSEFRYADKSDEAAIENAVRDMGRMDEARRRYPQGRGMIRGPCITGLLIAALIAGLAVPIARADPARACWRSAARSVCVAEPGGWCWRRSVVS